jgi:hypothetical protein
MSVLVATVKGLLAEHTQRPAEPNSQTYVSMK